MSSDVAGELVTPGELLEAAGPAARERPLSWNKRKYQSYVFIIILLFGLNIVNIGYQQSIARFESFAFDKFLPNKSDPNCSIWLRL